MYQYSYLIGDLSLFIVWLILFLKRKDSRKEMLFVSIIFGFIGLIVEPVFTTDWWHPLTITSTRIGLEDFLFGFVVGGTAAVIYELIFRKTMAARRADQKRNGLKMGILFLFGTILFFGNFFILKWHSFWASLIAVLGTTSVIWIKRKDLILNSLVSGFLIVLIGFLFFVIPEALSPGWVLNHWYIENLTGIIIFKAPLEDLIWVFTVGLLIGPLYEFWQGYRLKDKK